MSMRFFATCKLGLESVVAGELRALLIEVDTVEDARIAFSGDAHTLARALLWLRSAERVFLEIGAFPASSFDELFEGVKALDWKRYLPRDAFIHVNGKSAKSTLKSVPDCQRITKKAIVENLKTAYKTDILPETGKEVIVEAGLLRDRATLALDACGAGLSRRGYRTYNVQAPVSETLGAALVLLSRYRGTRPFLDPMCGSGTLPIEAAMIAHNMAPGMNRRFQAEEWSFLDGRVFEAARRETKDLENHGDVPPIMGSDIDARSIELCKQHAKKAGVHLEWAVRDVRDLEVKEAGGILVTNPPYGERMLEKKEALRLYGDMRRAFSGLNGWSIHILSGSSDFERAYGRRADKRRNLSNGGLKCTFFQYFS